MLEENLFNQLCKINEKNDFEIKIKKIADEDDDDDDCKYTYIKISLCLWLEFELRFEFFFEPCDFFKILFDKYIALNYKNDPKLIIFLDD